MTAANLDAIVGQILQDIRERGDTAVKEYTQKFDKVTLNHLEVSPTELAEAEALLDSELKTAIQTAKSNIKSNRRRDNVAFSCSVSSRRKAFW